MKSKINWAKVEPEINVLINKIYNDAVSLSQKRNSFSVFETKASISTRGSHSNSNNVASYFKYLYDSYRRKQEIENLRYNEYGAYYYGSTRQEIERYAQEVDYYKKVPYSDKEYYHDRETRYRDKTAYYTETYQEWERVGSSSHFIFWRKAEYGYVTKTRQVPYQTKESYTVDVQKERYVTKYRDEAVYKSVPVYRYIPIREFNSSTYSTDLSNTNSQISSYRSTINSYISTMPKSGKGCAKIAIASNDNFEKQYEDLMTQWRDAEYDAYFAQNGSKSLEYQ